METVGEQVTGEDRAGFVVVKVAGLIISALLSDGEVLDGDEVATGLDFELVGFPSCFSCDLLGGILSLDWGLGDI